MPETPGVSHGHKASARADQDRSRKPTTPCSDMTLSEMCEQLKLELYMAPHSTPEQIVERVIELQVYGRRR